MVKTPYTERDNDDTVGQSLDAFLYILENDYRNNDALFYTRKILVQAILDWNRFLQDYKDMQTKLQNANQANDELNTLVDDLHNLMEQGNT